MLTRKHGLAIGNLLGQNDLKVIVVVLEKKSSDDSQELLDRKRKQVIEDSLGSDVVNDSVNDYLIGCITENEIINFTIKGNHIIDEFLMYIKNVYAIRIDITKLPTNNNGINSWIFVIE